MDDYPWHRHPFFPACALVFLLGLAGTARWGYEAWLRPLPDPPPPGSIVAPWIRVNEALPHEIAAIPGIGPATARAIVRDRRRNGPFHSLAEVDRVPGVGPATLAKMAPFLSFEMPADGSTPPPPWPSP